MLTVAAAGFDGADIRSIIEGSQIGISSSAAGHDNIPFRYTGGLWKPVRPGGEFRFAPGAEYLVYYPYSAGMNGKAAKADMARGFTVPEDQSDYDTYEAGNLMIGAGTVQGETLAVVLTPGMALIEAVFPAGARDMKLRIGPGDIIGKAYTQSDGRILTCRYLVKPGGGAVTVSGAYWKKWEISEWRWEVRDTAAGEYIKVN